MDPNGLDINYMPFPIAPQLHHHPLHMGQHQHPHNMPLLQAVTQMHHQPQSGLGGMQHASGLDFMTQHGPGDPHQHLQSLQQAELSDHLPRRRNRKHELDANKPKKRQRSKKPVDAPTRPKSAYMFFLGEFREQYKIDNPDSKKVAEVASAAGEKWRSLSEEEKRGYEESSEKAKADYRVIMAEYEKDHPKPPRRQKRARDPTELKRPQSAYFFFLADFREQYKREHPDEATAVKIIGREAGERWKNMSNEDKEPYETQSNASKAEYARMKLLTPAERIMVLAAQAMHHPDGSLLVPQYMAAQLDPSMGMDPSMERTLQQEEEEDQYNNGLEDAIHQEQGDAHQDEAPHDSDHIQQLQASSQQQAEGQIAQVLRDRAAPDGAGPAEADSDSPVGGNAAEQEPPLSPQDDPHGQPSSEVAASSTPDQAEEQRAQQQAQRHFRPSPDAVPHMAPQLPSQVQVRGHSPVMAHRTSVTSHQQQQLHQQQLQQQQQGQEMMPRVAHYQQPSEALLHFQQYRSDMVRSQHQQQQQQGLALGIHEYQQHPGGLMHFQHQPQMAALQQHHQQQQMHGVGVGGMVGGVLGHQMQDRGEYYGDAGDDGTTSSQPMAMGLPLNYAQWSNPPSGY
ncbi:TPA: hypothetical protein ACH3X2_012071 [Trebouxia sp. C0005]